MILSNFSSFQLFLLESLVRLRSFFLSKTQHPKLILNVFSEARSVNIPNFFTSYLTGFERFFYQSKSLEFLPRFSFKRFGNCSLLQILKDSFFLTEVYEPSSTTQFTLYKACVVEEKHLKCCS